MSEDEIVEMIEETLGNPDRYREPLYAFTPKQVEALEVLGMPMRRVSEGNIIRGVIEDLKDAGYEVYPAAAIEAAKRLEFEVRYFDDHKPAECAVIRAADTFAGYVPTKAPR